MLLEGFEREPDRLSYYLLGAVAVHVVLLAFGSISSCHKHDLVEVMAPSDKLVNIDMEPPPPPVEHPKTPEPGGGSIVGKEEPDDKEPPLVVRRPSAPKAKAPPPKVIPREEEETVDEAPETVAAKTEGEDTDAGEEGGTVAMEVPDAAPEPVVPEVAHYDPEAAAASRHHRDFAGSGPGTNGGPGGFGAGWGGGKWNQPVPMIHGQSAFGGSGAGALRGVICFVPETTVRLTDVQRCEPVAAFVTNELNVPPRRFEAGFPGVSDRTEYFAIDYSGVFNVHKEGDYSFRLLSDDGSYLYIDGAMIINNDGTHGPESKTGDVHLTAANHNIRVLYFQGHKWMLALQLFVKPPGINEVEKLFSPNL
jgi:hypothetical protein